MSDLLNPYQKNSLRISLLMFEDNLRHAQAWLDGHEENGILYRRKLDVPERNKKQARKVIATALEIIEKLARTFEFETEVESASAIMRGELVISWENLMNTQARRLRGYGEVHPQLASVLDADIQNLAEMSFRLSELLNGSEPNKEDGGTYQNAR